MRSVQPFEKNIYYLRDESLIPPQNYGAFLSNIVSKFEQFILNCHKVNSLEEFVEKSRRKFKREGIDPDDDWEGPAISDYLPYIINMAGKFRFRNDCGKKRIKEWNTRFTDYTEREFGCERLQIDSYETGIEENLERVARILDYVHPGRNGTIPGSLIGKAPTKLGNLDHLELKLQLVSVGIYTLELDVSLICEDSMELMSPHIKVRASLSKEGPKTIVRNLMNIIDEDVRTVYDVGPVIQSQGVWRPG